uniref:trypsin n=1 Tax=Seriola lalandi dorsalis TaxID=1841481 RepID=A0A3B4X6I6_SERLL
FPRVPTAPTAPTAPTIEATSPTYTVPKAPEKEEFLDPKCREKKFTRSSCDLVFCPPWERCVDGECSCKPPYLCPIDNVVPVCGRTHLNYRSYCQAMAVSCRTKKPAMSHFGENCDGLFLTDTFSTIHRDTSVKIFIPNNIGDGEELLVCEDMWDMAAANVACKENGKPLGAAIADSVSYSSLTTGRPYGQVPERCVSIRCQGYETSLAECVIYKKTKIDNERVATATCYEKSKENCEPEFTCTNSKCVSLNQTCDGVDDCGDRSDEMCCKKCRNDGFLCKTGVCLHKEAVHDGQRDCLDGEDELSSVGKNEEEERRVLQNLGMATMNVHTDRENLESKLKCGVPNMDIVDDEVHERGVRVKRVVGGHPAKPTQIQWQVALEERGKIDCGGAYIGGCWVLTAAHCVRPNPSLYRVKFSLWKKAKAQDTTDIVPVEEVNIHPNSYENDIALVKLQKLPFKEECFEENPAIRSVCLPWSPELFRPNHTCSISGWGRTADGKASQVLLWANVSLINNCERYYAHRFKPGMMCAGDLAGSVDSCQGDSGGPLVCEDELGVSYLWGIVSWGEQCGQPGFPGVYTQVADYFDWVRLYTGWPEVTKFNS